MKKRGITDEVFEKGLAMYKAMSNYVKAEKSRIGGDWVVAQAVPSRALRDEIRKLLPNVIFITLTIDEEALKTRLEIRHGSDGNDAVNWLMALHKFYEPAEKDEPNAFDIKLKPSLSPDDVIETILDKIK